MSDSDRLDRRGFLGSSIGTVGACAAIGASASADEKTNETKPDAMPFGMLGKLKVSRLMLGGNLVSGYMHARDLKYVGRLFRAYVDEEKIFETFKLAEANGINTVLESGAEQVARYNKECGGQMRIIPSIHPGLGQPEQKLKDEIKRKIDGGAPSLYVWGVAGDKLVQAGAVSTITRAVELAKAHDIPVGVGSHSLKVPMACEKHKVPCDYYVKTLHADTYASAIPKEHRKEFIWLDGGQGWNDNMWCIDPDETIEFMQTVAKPWVAFKVLAAGAITPRQGFAHAFRSGADFIAVGMFDFQIEENSKLTKRLVKREKDRNRPWRA